MAQGCLCLFYNVRQRRSRFSTLAKYSNAQTSTLGLLLAQGILITYELYTTAAHWHITRASFHVGYLYEFFRTVLAATVTVFLLQLSPGIHQALVGATNTVDKIVKVFAYVMGFIVTALALAYYGLLADFQEEYTNNLGSIHQISEAYERAWTVNRLMGATAIILWVESLLITILSVYTFIHRRASQMKSVSSTLAVTVYLTLPTDRSIVIRPLSLCKFIQPFKLNLELYICCSLVVTTTKSTRRGNSGKLRAHFEYRPGTLEPRSYTHNHLLYRTEEQKCRRCLVCSKDFLRINGVSIPTAH